VKPGHFRSATFVAALRHRPWVVVVAIAALALAIRFVVARAPQGGIASTNVAPTTREDAPPARGADTPARDPDSLERREELESQAETPVAPIPNAPSLDGEFEVRVVDGRTREPVKGEAVVGVAIDPDSETPGLVARFAADGHTALPVGATRRTTNDAGSVKFPWPPLFGMTLFCAHGDVRGVLDVDDSMPIPVTLELWPARSAVARVVDRDGAPIEDVTVAFGRASRNEYAEHEADRATSFLPDRETLECGTVSGPDGVARLDAVDLHSAGARFGDPFLGTWILGGEEVVVPVADDHPANEPVQLVLPDVGGIVVRIVDEHGVVQPCDTIGTLSVAGSRGSQRDRTLRIANGIGRLRGIRPGTLLDLSLFELVPSFERAGIDGPAVDGQDVVVDVVARTHRWQIAGRAVDRSAKPILGAHLAWWNPAKSAGPDSNATSTGDDGRFAFGQSSTFGSDETPTLAMRIVAADHRHAIGATRALPTRTDESNLDLGDVVFEPLPVAVSGRVVEPERTPIAGASLILFSGRGAALARSSDDGSFEFFGPLDLDGARLFAAAERHDGFVLESIESSTFPLEIVLARRALPMVGRIRVDGPLPSHGLILGAVPRGTSIDFDSLVGLPSVRDDGRFVLTNLNEGVFDFVAGLAVDDRLTPLAVVPSIEVGAKSVAADPRLDPLDLRELVDVVRVHVVGARAGSIRVFEQASRRVLVADDLDRPWFEGAFACREVAVELSGRECRRTVLEHVRGEVTMRVAPAIDAVLSVRFADPAAQAFAVSEHLGLETRPADETPIAMGGWSSLRDADAVEFHVTDFGHWQLRVLAPSNGPQHGSMVDLDLPPTTFDVIDESPKECRLAYSVAELRAALDALRLAK
jgi:hypothetical protein